ncbi:hypothetical protein PG988_006109 [Apiospora saccharicola]
MTSQGDCPANGAKRSFNTARADETLFSLCPHASPSYSDKRPCTTDVRFIPDDGNTTTSTSESLALSGPKNSVGTDCGACAPELESTDTADNVSVRSGGQDQSRRDFDVDSDGLAGNHLVHHYTQSRNPDFDTCFGTIHIEIPNLRYSENDVLDPLMVKLEPLGSHLGIFDVTGGGYQGSISTNLVASVYDLQRDNAARASFELIFKPPALHITMYGCRTRAEYIGDSLADSGLFLQAPRIYNEYAPYFNPQYLVPPGAEYEPTTVVDLDEIRQKEALDPSQKSKIMQILDENIGPTTSPEVFISSRLETNLKEYQKVALAMMMEKERDSIVGNQFPSLWDETETSGNGGREIYSNNVTGGNLIKRPNPCLGGILADDMGLGKTLTTLALILGSLYFTSTLRDEGLGRAPKATGTLIVVPLSTLMSWEEQIHRHIKTGGLKYLKYHGQSKNSAKNNIREYDVVLTTYETLRRETHVIRNRSSKVFQAVTSLKAKHRWCLTGTPIQNHVQDLGSLVEFLRIDIFADPKRFRALILDPVGRNDSEGFQRLKRLFQGIAMRRTKDSVMKELKLPLKSTKEELVALDPEEKQLYDLVKNSGAMFIRRHQKHSALQTILKLRQIANHGRELVPAELIQKVDRLGRGALVDLAADACESCGVTIKQEDAEAKLASVDCWHQICTACCSVTTETTLTGSKCPLCSDNGASIPSKKKNNCRSQQPKDKSTRPYKPSSKVKALLRNLEADRTGSQHNDGKPCKSVVFSCWAGMLDLIDRALDEAEIGNVRIDGAVSETARRQAVDKFRKDDSITVLLATIGTAGVGLDLTVASRVHLMEPQWNPMVERQAVDRVFRLGQTRDVLTISYIMSGEDSVDQYILQTQKRKLNLVQVCVDDTDGEGIAESASRWVESITGINQEKIREEDPDVDMTGQ